MKTRTSWASSALILATGLVSLVGLVGCSDDSGKAVPVNAGPTTARPAELAHYCDQIAAYAAATKVDISTVATFLDSVSKAAVAARAAADAAPAEIHAAHEQLAASSEELNQELRKQNYQTMDDLEAGGQAVTERLRAKYGDLEKETADVKAYALAKCGVIVK